MYRTGDPIDDFNRYEAECERQLKKLPRCSECDEHITDDYAYYINGEWICEQCMKDNYRREVEADL